MGPLDVERVPDALSDPAVESDPSVHDTWFSRLGPEEQAELRRRWNRRAEEQALQTRRERRRALIDFAFVIVAFALGDLVHGWDGLASFASALAVGAFLGGLILVLEANRNLAAVIGTCGLFGLQWIARGGLTLGEAALLLPLAVVFWLVGRRREAPR